jgi:NAD(P)-dependent dehydrogenase (short-subunit alcohol dehydrogenase family)
MGRHDTGRYAGKVAVVTGGASGIGAAFARLVVDEGGSVVIADIGGDRASALAGDLGKNAHAVTCDVTDESQVAAAVDAAVATFGRLDGVFANAGIVGAAGPFALTPMEDFDKTMNVLCRGVFATVKHGARVMQEQGEGGAIVCTSSIAGIVGGLGPHVYAVAKTAVIGMARSAASELMAHGIRVNAISPGSIPTGMTAHVMTGDVNDVDKATAIMGARAKLGRAGTADDIAETALFLMGDAGSYLTGQVLVVDGGELIAPYSANWTSPRMVIARP